MAELVAGIGVPHSPHYPVADRQGRPTHEHGAALSRGQGASRRDAAGRDHRDRQRPFQHVLPEQLPDLRASGSRRRASAPTTRPGCRATISRSICRSPSTCAGSASARASISSVTQEFGVDHAMLVPLHYLTDGITTPVVPIWVNTFVKPLPTARRCYALGRAVRSAIDSFPDKLRVAVIGTGSFSLEIGGPKIKPGQAQRRARHRLVEAHPPPDQGRAVRRADRGSDARADVEGRQYRRRAAELDRDARHDRQGQARATSRTTTTRTGMPMRPGGGIEHHERVSDQQALPPRLPRRRLPRSRQARSRQGASPTGRSPTRSARRCSKATSAGSTNGACTRSCSPISRAGACSD